MSSPHNEVVDLSEKSRTADGQEISLDRRLFMQLQAFGKCYDTAALKEDNDFVVALLGPELFPLSSIVQRMRKTKQTSSYLERLGPFFAGKAVWRREEAGA